MADKKAYGLIFALIAVVTVGIAVAYFSSSNSTGNVSNVAVAQDMPDEMAESVNIDVTAALQERILGNPSAPVKISEHSSFTCGHCGKFHQDVFVKLKEEFIDTGKAYLVFSDFPLNGPALHASMVARCLPQDKFFNFVDMLFERQEDWAYDAGYLTFLKQKAVQNGLTPAEFQACLKNQELRAGILNRMQAAQAQWQVRATPSFVINNKTLIGGALPFEEFAKKINEAANN